MKTHHITLFATFLFLSISGCSTQVKNSTTPKEDANRSLLALADEFYAASLQRNPQYTSFLGLDDNVNDKLTDHSLEALSLWRKKEDKWLNEIKRIRSLDNKYGNIDNIALMGLLEHTYF